MRLKYKNLRVKFSYAWDMWEGQDGMNEMVIKKRDMQSFLDYNHWDMDTLPSYDQEEVFEWLCTEKSERQDYICKDADLMIVFMNFVFYDYDKPSPTYVDYYGDTPMWLCHDISHAENDVGGGQVTVDVSAEIRAVFESMEIAKEMKILTCINAKMLADFDQAFKSRFGREFPVQRAIEELNSLISK